MPCKRAFSQACIWETVVSKTHKAKASEAKTRFSCITEAHESTRQRIESVTEGFMKNSLLEKGRILYCIQFLVPKFVPMPQAMTIPDAKAAVDK